MQSSWDRKYIAFVTKFAFQEIVIENKYIYIYLYNWNLTFKGNPGDFLWKEIMQLCPSKLYLIFIYEYNNVDYIFSVNKLQCILFEFLSSTSTESYLVMLFFFFFFPAIKHEHEEEYRYIFSLFIKLNNVIFLALSFVFRTQIWIKNKDVYS